MFERITFREQNKVSDENPIDIGLLLESMLFYQSVYVIANRSILRQLIKVFGFEDIKKLLDLKILEILYTESNTGIFTNTQPNGLVQRKKISFLL